jgi:hypothetical protein
VTVLTDPAVAADVLSSLQISPDARLTLILYAARAGAFVDLAADLSWLTGRPLSDFVLDQHQHLAAGPLPADSVRSTSLINQAIGTLLGDGHTLEGADRELDARAATAGLSRLEAATVILGE